MDIRARFDAAFTTWVPRVLVEIEALLAAEATPGSTLSRMCLYHLETGGKRLRAVLPLLVAEDLGQDPASFLPFAAACEVLHNATLVHDDLQDGDQTRRGRPTVWAHFGMPQAVNLGDAMFYWSLLLVQRLQAPVETREALSALLLRETLRVIDGQEREFNLKKLPSPQLTDYFTMVEGKTSGLFALPLCGAARLAGASELCVAALAESARHLGVLFQVQDDVLDLYGDKGRGGAGSDIAEGKRSILAVHALAQAPAVDVRRLREILDRPREETTLEDIVWASDLFRQVGSLQFALEEIHRRAGKAVVPELPPAIQRLVGGLASLFLGPIQGLVESA